jgi:hypothetical protein
MSAKTIQATSAQEEAIEDGKKVLPGTAADWLDLINIKMPARLHALVWNSKKNLDIIENLYLRGGN